VNQLAPVVLETVTGPDTLQDIECCLDDFWSSCGNVPEDIRTQVAIAVAEVSANIIEHAARGASVPMRMELQLLPGEVHVGFHDQGVPVDVDLANPVMPSELAQRGRGLALAAAVMNRVSYARDDTGNHWTLVSKRFDQPAC
jgi:serine/threonine-protein kinase RsbW